MPLTRLADALRRSPAPLDPDLDVEFYRTLYPDLKAIRSEAALHRHYIAHGRAEGRFANEAQAIAALEKDLGPLPPGFRASTYRAMHGDLRTALKTDLEAAEHYLRQGRKERRDYVRFDPDLYKALYFSDKVITDYELELHYKTVGLAEGRFGTWREYLESKGVSGGAWLDRLKVDEFELLNWSWAGRIGSKLDAVRAFLDEGLARLAPIAFDAQFEPAYFREAHPEYAKATDVECYRAWLFEGLARNWAGSEREHLAQLRLNLPTYPKSFDWRAYATANRLSRPTRWTALAHLVEAGLPRGAAFPAAGSDAAAFATAVGLSWRGGHDSSAIVAFRHARASGDLGYATAHHLGDAHFRQGQWKPALALLQEAAKEPGAELWTYINGSRAAVRLGAYQAAFDMLRAGRSAVGGEPVWRRAVHETVEAYFASRTGKARRLYAREQGRARADELIAKFVDKAGEYWNDLDPIGAPLDAAPDGKIVILASFDLKVCTHYRIEQKEELFEALGRPYEVYGLDQWEAFISALPGAAAAIIFRLPAWPTVTRAITAARKMGVPTYYEIDDLIFDSEQYPDTLESYGGLLSREDYESIQFGVPLFRKAIQLCDYGISSTPPLARAVEPLVRTGQVFWLPNGLDSRNEPYLDAPPDRVRKGDDIWIAYASGTKAHNTDFNELAAPALLELLQDRSDVKLLLVGYLALPDDFDAVREQIIRFDYVPGAESFWSMLADADINLAVLKPTWATDSKSEIKWLESAVMGIPSIVSDTATYLEALTDGEDALIARTPDEWRTSLRRMVDDADLRRRIGQRARETARAQYSVKANAKRLDALLKPALNERKPRRAKAGKKRVLLGNVWFPPQAVGGATRVVRDNLDAWIDAGLTDEFEFAVVTTDAGVEPAYRVRVDEYRGVPVQRIATPMRINMDWRPEDHQVKRIFTRLLESWSPDLVHFHAIQRLTASAPQACQTADIPYLVTVHDAWWLSDWHFLIDDEGRRREPCEDLPVNPPKGVSVAQALDRRRLLRAALDGAEAVLGVSHSFTDMHRSCGFEHAIAVPNGSPPLRLAARTPSQSGRVRLAHVGNVSKHKGYHLVQAALKQGRFPNLELTVIDHGRSAGAEEHLIWGETPVRITGKTPQEEMHRLYARTDVLLAPSIWPESYGLVAREALSAGLWVVASDLGAMGEDVTPGVNGFVIDVSTVEGLADALGQINADPARYLASPAERPAIRRAEQQAAELMAIYRRVLAGERLSGDRPNRIPFAGTVATEPERLEVRTTEFARTRAARRT